MRLSRPALAVTALSAIAISTPGASQALAHSRGVTAPAAGNVRSAPATVYPSVTMLTATMGTVYSHNITGEHFSSPVVADVGSGPEVIVGFGDGTVHAWSPVTHAHLWSFWTGAGAVLASPVIADLNGDGRLDVIAANTAGNVIAFTPALGNKVIFSVHTGDGVPNHPPGDFATPAVADLNRDGHLDLIETSWDHHIHAWAANGHELPGFPVFLQDTSWSSPTVTDIDGDGWPEIVFGYDCDGVSGQNCYPNPGGYVGVLRHDGHWQPGWPRFISGQVVWSSPAVADLNGDGHPDIVVGTGNMPPPHMPYGQYVYAFNANGSYVSGWPVHVAGRVASSPAIGSVTGSGLQVAVVDDTGRLNLINHDGHILWTRCVRDSPTACPAALHASAIIADIDGNGTQDVVVGGEQWVWAFSGNGTTLVGAPSVAGTNPLTAAPTVTNVNGHTTIIAAGEDTVNSPMTARLFLWQPAGMVLGRAVWPTFKRGNDRSADIASLASPGVTWAGGNQPDVFDASPTGPSVEERAYQGSSWSALWNLGGATYDGVATATDTAGTTAVFIRGLNNGVYERVRQGGGWTGWTALGGATVQTPAAAALPGGGFAEAVIGTDEAVWVHTGGWTRLGGAAIGAPAIASLGGSDLLVAVTGTDRRVWTDRYVGGRWSGWLPLSGSSRFGPTLAGTPAGADLYVTGSDGALWATSTARSGSWVGWHSLGGHLMSPPSAYTDGNGHTGVVAYGIDARLWLHSASGSWSAVP